MMILFATAPAFGQFGDDAGIVTGRDFAGLLLPVDVQAGDAFIEARGGWAWLDGEARRLLLEGDVRVRLSVYDFMADRAVAWIEPRLVDGRRIWQLAFYFENLRTPLASAEFSQSARRLLVTAAIDGDVRLRVALLDQDRPHGDPLLEQGETRFSRRLNSLIAEGAPQTIASGFDYFDRTFFEASGAPAPLDPDAPIFPHNGVITFHGPDRTFITGEEENSLVVTGGVVVQYTDVDANRTMQLTSQNAVVFLDPGSVAEMIEFKPENVRGIYLEGNVIATDGEFTVRGPRVYYDVRLDRAALMDAVFYTYDAKRGMPLYVRADVIRQEALGQWEAQGAKLANVAFADPHFAVGARSVKLTQERDETGVRRNIIDARGVTLQLGDTPIIPLPRYRGEFDHARLPSVRVSSKEGSGVIETRWDFDSMLNLDPDDALDGDILIDGYFNRGPAIGLDLGWATPEAFGSLFAYYVYDEGEDRFTTGAERDPSSEHRGLFLGEHQWRINESWTLALEGSYISDEAFIDAFFEPIAEVGREVTNRAALSYRGDNSFFLAQVQGSLNDFSPNEYLLQSRGYQVQRLPEASYWRLGDSFFNGRLNYLSETRAGILKAAFNDPPVNRFGFISPALSQAAFGINPGESLADRLRASGFEEDAVARFDTRHELSASLDVGSVRFIPFAVGRVTMYSDDFESFRTANGFDEDESTRLWGAAGLTVSTAMHRVYNGVDSNLFDLHRLRHIIEPSATIWTATSNVDSETFPVYDESVESLAEGTAFRVGITNTFQTQRGGPGAWRNVDWLVIRAEYVYSSGNTTRESAIGRFFEIRPELSRFGEFAAGEAILQLTDAVGVVGSVIYDTDDSTLDTVSAGALIDHGYGFTSFVELRRIDADVIDSTFLNVGGSYEISARYSVAGAAVIDLEDSNLQALGFEVRRRFPQWTLELGLDYDDIRDDVALSVRFRPWGGPTDRIRNSLSRERFTAGSLARNRRGSLYY